MFPDFLTQRNGNDGVKAGELAVLCPGGIGVSTPGGVRDP